MKADSTNSRFSRLPIPIKRALHALGGDLKNARRRRRIPSALLAERSSISRTTLVKIEKGEPGVSIGAYAHVLMSLGMIERLAGLAEAKHDEIGLVLEEERLPERIRQKPYQTK
ncbi:MAG: hypothetical protein L3J79_02055 [Candidatus Marinimicrobia bacterium]|nr:hypothetical protein [Candidatus Neomarinimicrobiota bacterium]